MHFNRERSLFGLEFEVTVHNYRDISDRSLRQLVKGKKNEFILATLYSVPWFLYCYIVKDFHCLGYMVPNYCKLCEVDKANHHIWECNHECI